MKIGDIASNEVKLYNVNNKNLLKTNYNRLRET